MATVTITGIDEVMRNLRLYAERTKGAVGMALHEEARAIEEVSVTRFVPVDLGGLRRDHAFVDEAAKVEGSKVSVSFGYRGPYAAAVHENPRAGKTGGVSPSGRKYRHWATVGQYKFLEIPLLQAENGMLRRIRDRIYDIVGSRLS